MSDENGTLLTESLAVTAVAIAAFTAALLGTVFGIAVSRRRGRSGVQKSDIGSNDGGDLISWTRLSRLEAELDDSRRELEGLKRDYELDTGLLKQEIQRLELLLGRFSSPKVESGSRVKGPAPKSEEAPGYHSLRLVDPLAGPEGPFSYSTLASIESGAALRSTDS
ncbi:MAG: hypothetical protein KJO98_09035 [Rhodothermia bacterium]|nr:hypothetical protein [Rhodothermia bacterium]